MDLGGQRLRSFHCRGSQPVLGEAPDQNCPTVSLDGNPPGFLLNADSDSGGQAGGGGLGLHF